jgi:SAM-dependent methyltransferase
MSSVKESVQSYWDSRSELFNNYYERPSLFDGLFRRGIYERVAVAIKACRELDRPAVLDIGSGPGANSVSMIKNTSTVRLVGIDFSRHMVDLAKAKTEAAGVGDKCEFILGDVMTHDFGRTKFDFSMGLGLFDYVEDAPALIRKIAELTTGSFVISWPEDGVRMALRRRRYTCPLFHYSTADIRQLHAQAGISRLELIKIGGGWATIARK